MDRDLFCACLISRSFPYKSLVAKSLIEYFQNPQEVFRVPERTLFGLLPAYKENIRAMFSKKSATETEHELNWAIKQGITPIHYNDARFPSRLRECPDSPVVLFSKGDCQLQGERHVSIVGTRKATEYGKNICDLIVERLSLLKTKPVIISGMAYGIDSFVHRAAIRCGLKTIAVMGTGLNKIYPAGNRALAEQIAANGALLTEYFTDSIIQASSFVSRNRIIAGLADAVIVCQSAAQGGSLITAKMAFNYGREVFAVPGRINDIYSEGCNNLIRKNIANIYISTDHFLKAMNWKSKEKISEPELDLPTMSEGKTAIISLLKENEGLNLSEIAATTGLDKNQVSLDLIELEMENIIVSSPSGRYMCL